MSLKFYWNKEGKIERSKSFLFCSNEQWVLVYFKKEKKKKKSIHDKLWLVEHKVVQRICVPLWSHVCTLVLGLKVTVYRFDYFLSENIKSMISFSFLFLWIVFVPVLFCFFQCFFVIYTTFFFSELKTIETLIDTME